MRWSIAVLVVLPQVFQGASLDRCLETTGCRRCTCP